MSAIGALVSVGTVAALVGIGGAALNSVIAQNAYKEAEPKLLKGNQQATETFQQAGEQGQAALDPYAQAGTDALQQQRDLAGLNGPAAQQAAYNAIQNSPQFNALLQQQEQGILANASATGGLRGGNVQQALAQGRSQLLTDVINQQYGQFAGLSQAGQNAATQQGALGLNTAANVAGLQNQRGQIQAGTITNTAQAQIRGISEVGNNLSGVLGAASAAAGVPGGV